MANEKNTSTDSHFDFEAEIKRTSRALAATRDSLEMLQHNMQEINRTVDGHDLKLKSLEEKVRVIEEAGPRLDSKGLAVYLGTLAGGATLFIIGLAAAGGIGSRVYQGLISKDQLEHERALEKLALTPSPLIVSGGTTVPTSPTSEVVRGSFMA